MRLLRRTVVADVAVVGGCRDVEDLFALEGNWRERRRCDVTLELEWNWMGWNGDYGDGMEWG